MIRHIHHVNGEASRHTVFRHILLEETTVGLGISLSQPFLFNSKSLWIDQWIRRFRLASKGVNLDKIDLFQRITNPGLL